LVADKNINVLTNKYPQVNLNAPIYINNNPHATYDFMPKNIEKYFSNKDAVRFNHNWSVTDEIYREFPVLDRFFDRGAYAGEHKKVIAYV